MTAGELFSGIEGFICGVPEGAADADGVVVTQIAAYLAKDHGYRIGGKFYILGNIEIVNGFDKADAADLKEIIDIFLASGKTLDHA